jgi:cyclophilin family peptidyl-prolyl cis-trans isomerase
LKSKLRVAFLFAAALACGCSHHSVNQSSGGPAPSGDSDLTGIPAQPINSHLKTPPRATLVALPPATTPAPGSASVPTTDSGFPPASPPPSGMATTTTAAATPPVSTLGPEAAPSTDSVPPSTDAMSSPTTVPSPSTAAPTPSSPSESLPADQQNKVVVLQTSAGRILIELDDFAAPKTCKNFRELVTDGFYNNTVFHRVIPNFIIQGGDPKSKSTAVDRDTFGLGGPGYTLPAEIELKHDRGAVAMARLPDEVNPKRESNGSQFYICVAPCPSLDDQYTVFGHVIKGMEVVDAISNEPRDRRDNPLKRIEMMASMESKDQAMGDSAAGNP